jgi:hypothetical protein
MAGSAGLRHRDTAIGAADCCECSSGGLVGRHSGTSSLCRDTRIRGTQKRCIARGTSIRTILRPALFPVQRSHMARYLDALLGCGCAPDHPCGICVLARSAAASPRSYPGGTVRSIRPLFWTDLESRISDAARERQLTVAKIQQGEREIVDLRRRLQNQSLEIRALRAKRSRLRLLFWRHHRRKRTSLVKLPLKAVNLRFRNFAVCLQFPRQQRH